MSEAAEAPKKKGKLPMIVVMLVVLLAGGFFGMKMKGGGEKKEPEIKLGEIHELEPFLVNLSNPSDYVHTKISLQTKEGFDKKGFEKNLAAVRDAIIAVVGSKRMSQVNTEVGRALLKREIAAKVNAALLMLDPKKEEEKDKDDKKSQKDDKKESKESNEVEEPSEPEHPDWDSDTGPVLKVYFTEFTTQQG
ncbi:MAG TPA: flagellar basal body-associated FliL family protein [Fimbriimonadaceae bacterium]|nr:flagellar basal body-associated FliL family protein [Fimbriimonadaceae bacterium]HRJ34030.1 flagellar basal body-associated FliL family protein [Fimbriimonadaceae bacterium]